MRRPARREAPNTLHRIMLWGIERGSVRRWKEERSTARIRPRMARRGEGGGWGIRSGVPGLLGCDESISAPLDIMSCQVSAVGYLSCCPRTRLRPGIPEPPAGLPVALISAHP
jgi:hypothetical protein